jgi:hypothetical protein
MKSLLILASIWSVIILGESINEKQKTYFIVHKILMNAIDHKRNTDLNDASYFALKNAKISCIMERLGFQGDNDFEVTREHIRQYSTWIGKYLKEMMLIGMSATLCPPASEVGNFNLTKYIDSSLKQHIGCLKKEVKGYDPNSLLVKNFKSSSVSLTIEECYHLLEETPPLKIDKENGQNFLTALPTECAVLQARFENTIYKMAILANDELSKEIKDSEMEKVRLEEQENKRLLIKCGIEN